MIARTGSVAIKTDNVHYKSDLMLNGAVIVALVLDQALHIAGADALFGIAIALWLVWGALRASSEAVNQLMDREWPEDERQEFLAACARISGARGASRPSHAQAAAPCASPSSTSGFRPTGPCSRRTTGSTRVEEELQERFPGHRNPDPRRSGGADRPRDPAAQEHHGESGMTSIPFFQVDAFAERPADRQSGGGHAARTLARRCAAAGHRRRE